MKTQLKHACMIVGPIFAMVSLLLAVGGISSGCQGADNIDSYFVCQDYCDKKFDCNSQDPSSDEINTCVSECRTSIEDNCGNEHQAAANDLIGECVDQGCAEFWTCMHLEAAPKCHGFVTQ
jgi:hypothetical protein